MAAISFLRDAEWRNRVLRDAFGRSFWGFFGFAVVMGALCYAIKGEAAFATALGSDVELLLKMLPRVVVALSIAALIWVMLPRDRISALVGTEAGIAGIVIATLAGTVTPGGPSAAYALLAVLGASGADRGAMVAYITAWATLGMQRILVWDVPFMGAEFAILRILVSLPLPIIAGLIAQRLPLQMTLVEQGPPAGGRR